MKYHLLPSFLLAGYQAQQNTIAAQAEKIDASEQRLQRLEALLPQTKAARAATIISGKCRPETRALCDPGHIVPRRARA